MKKYANMANVGVTLHSLKLSFSKVLSNLKHQRQVWKSNFEENLHFVIASRTNTKISNDYFLVLKLKFSFFYLAQSIGIRNSFKLRSVSQNFLTVKKKYKNLENPNIVKNYRNGMKCWVKIVLFAIHLGTFRFQRYIKITIFVLVFLKKNMFFFANSLIYSGSLLWIFSEYFAF